MHVTFKYKITHHTIPQHIPNHTSHTAAFQPSFRITPHKMGSNHFTSLGIPQPHFTSCITAHHHIPPPSFHIALPHFTTPHLTLRNIAFSIAPYHMIWWHRNMWCGVTWCAVQEMWFDVKLILLRCGGG